MRTTLTLDDDVAACEPSRTRPVSLGRYLIGDIVSVSEALARAGGEDHK